MTTIPASVKAQLDSDWTGAGGAEPTYFVAEDYRVNPPLGGDSIWILDNTDTKPKPVNDLFVDESHTIDIIVTATTADRLKEISDEVIRILNASRVLDMTYQRYAGRRNTSGVDVNNVFINQEVITYDMKEQMKSGAAAYGAGTTGDFAVVGNLTVGGTSAFTGAATFSSTITTATAAQIDDLLMFGSANAAWVPCAFELHTQVGKGTLSSFFAVTNVDGTEINLAYRVPCSTLKGTLKLYISGVQIGVQDADGNDYLNTTIVYGVTHNAPATLNTDATNYTSAQQVEDTFTAVDCSSYDSILVALFLACQDSAQIDISYVNVRCYYDT